MKKVKGKFNSKKSTANTYSSNPCKTNSRPFCMMNCLFCYKTVQQSGDDGEDSSGDLESKSIAAATRLEVCNFLKYTNRLFGSSFDSSTSPCGCSVGSRWKDLLLCCQDCLTNVSRFNEYYHQMKCLELRLFWRLESLRNIMKNADKIPSRINIFRQGLDDVNIINNSNRSDKCVHNPDITEISGFRQLIIKHCTQYLKGSYPKVQLVRETCNDYQSEATCPKGRKKAKAELEYFCNPSLSDCEPVSVTSGNPLSSLHQQQMPHSLPITALGANPMLPLSEDVCVPLDSSFEPSSVPTFCNSIIKTEGPENMQNNIDMHNKQCSLPSEMDIDDQPRRLRSIHQCSTCKMTFSTGNRLQYHQNLVHANEKDFDVGSNYSGKSLHHDSTDSESSHDDGDDDDAPVDNLSEALPNTYIGLDESFSYKNSNENGASSSSESSNNDMTSDHDYKAGGIEKQEPAEDECISSAQEQSDQNRSEICKVDSLHPNIKNQVLNMSKKQVLVASGVSMSITDWAKRRGGKYKCTTANCTQQFVTEYELEIHSKLHGDFSCQFCNEKIKFAQHLAIHELEHRNDKSEAGLSPTEQNSLKCSRCQKTKFKAGKEGYIYHFLRKHLKLEMDCLRCPVCMLPIFGNTFRALTRVLMVHYKNVHNVAHIPPESVPKCDKCSAYFSKSIYLNRHVQQVHIPIPEQDSTFPCRNCGYQFKNKCRLHQHYSKGPVGCRLSKQEMPFVCTARADCGSRFETQEELDLHLHYKKCKSNTALVCQICGKVCRRKVAFALHMRKHNNKHAKDAHVCDICGKTFSAKYRLDTHMLYHSGPESWSFSCSVCSKKCASLQKLNQHMNTHTKEKPFVCHVCGEKYAHRHNWRNHMKTKHGAVITVRVRKHASPGNGEKLKPQRKGTVKHQD